MRTLGESAVLSVVFLFLVGAALAANAGPQYRPSLDLQLSALSPPSMTPLSNYDPYSGGIGPCGQGKFAGCRIPPSHIKTLVVAFLATAGMPRPDAAANTVDAVTTPGSGTLTMCRDWLLYKSCTTHHKIVLPERIAVGDNVELSYGSNPKHYTFHVALIRREGDSCTILSDASRAEKDRDKIEIAHCRLTTKPAVEAR